MEEGSVQVLDVREKDERDTGYIPGSVHMPFRLLRACGADCIENEERLTVDILRHRIFLDDVLMVTHSKRIGLFFVALCGLAAQ